MYLSMQLHIASPFDFAVDYANAPSSTALNRVSCLDAGNSLEKRDETMNRFKKFLLDASIIERETAAEHGYSKNGRFYGASC